MTLIPLKLVPAKLVLSLPSVCAYLLVCRGTQIGERVKQTQYRLAPPPVGGVVFVVSPAIYCGVLV
jgi:hypothetical protein